MLSVLERRSRLGSIFLEDRLVDEDSMPMVGDDRSAASLLLSLVGECCLRANALALAGDGFPTVLSTSVTSPMSDSMVPFPYIIGVVGVTGPVGP